VPSLLLRFIPERGGVLKWDRHWIAAVLTAQVATGAALGITAQVSWSWSSSATSCRSSAWSCSTWPATWPPFNLPARVEQLFGVGL
jgi:hypothetical protein